MTTDNDIKLMVQEKYGEIANQSHTQNASSCCGASACSTEVYNIMADDYTHLEGYAADADLGLGCGLPTAFAMIQPGDTVIDLGSGAGNDCFIARSVTGEQGKVIGIDFTKPMVDKARANAEKLGYTNVDFILGDIEAMPVEANIADVVVSNCVLNLVPNKLNVLKEVFRVLKPGAHFSISDIVLQGQLPDSLQQAAEMYAGCISGAIQKEVYLELIQSTGFSNIKIQKEKKIEVPDDILLKYISQEEIDNYKKTHLGIFSITVYAEKPLEPKSACCGSDCCTQ